MYRAISMMVALMASAWSISAQAAVVIGGTRVVFPAASRDTSVRIQNKGDDPALVQVWIDDGDEHSTPQDAKAPFAITPPIFRIEPGRGHALRIVHVGEHAPEKQETLYWLNVLEIPPRVDAGEGANTLQFAFRHRLKLFHRPAGLSMPPDRAAASLRWSVTGHGESTSLDVENPSPYVVSFNTIDLLPGDDGASSSVPLGGGMVLPGAITSFTLPAGTLAAGVRERGKVSFAVINDYGAVVPGSAPLKPLTP